MPGDPPNGNEFVRDHPIVSYLFGDMIRGFYVVGCLGLDLLAPVQVHLWFPGEDVLIRPPVVAATVALAYVEWGHYRALWPGASRPAVLDGRARSEASGRQSRRRRGLAERGLS